jgi:hypothetical protein
MTKIAKTVKTKAKKAPAKTKVKAVASVKRAGAARRSTAKAKVAAKPAARKTTARKTVAKTVSKTVAKKAVKV